MNPHGDVRWQVDASHHMITVWIHTETGLQILRLQVLHLPASAPLAAWLIAGCHGLHQALEATPGGRVQDLPVEWTVKAGTDGSRERSPIR